MNMLEALQWAKETGGWVRCVKWVPGVYIRRAYLDEFGKHLNWWVIFSENDGISAPAQLPYIELDEPWETRLPSGGTDEAHSSQS